MATLTKNILKKGSGVLPTTAPGARSPAALFPKCPTGIKGIDEITFGGLPKGRPTLVCGGAGSGKTLFAMEFLVRGALQYDEPGLFISFEESELDLKQNVMSLGWNLDKLISQKKLLLDYVYIERGEIEETGEYNLEGLFVCLDSAIDSIKVKRIALDTPEALFSEFTNQNILRSEFRRLLRWLKKKGVTAVITAEPGENTMTRSGIEEYVSDCVICLDQRLIEQIAIRRLRVAKYRGSLHGTNEYPFLIDTSGFSVLPVTSLSLDYNVSTERIATGIPRLDAMMGGKGCYRGSSIMISGTSGAGKTSSAASFAAATCKRGERCLYFCFEESPSQIMRNMRSIGIDLKPWVNSGNLQFQATRVTSYGLETHLSLMHQAIDEFKPYLVILDPASDLTAIATRQDAKNILTRLIDYMKAKTITSLFTELAHTSIFEVTETEISSLIDTWIRVRDIESGGEHNRGLYILKSRGMAHSNQIREFLLTDNGIELLDVYVGASGVVTGTARSTMQAEQDAAKMLRQQDIEQLERQLSRKQKAKEGQLAAIQADFDTEEELLKKAITEARMRESVLAGGNVKIAQMRGADKNLKKTRRPS
jgi:circadian clock protein KaiC